MSTYCDGCGACLQMPSQNTGVRSLLHQMEAAPTRYVALHQDSSGTSHPNFNHFPDFSNSPKKGDILHAMNTEKKVKRVHNQDFMNAVRVKDIYSLSQQTAGSESSDVVEVNSTFPTRFHGTVGDQGASLDSFDSNCAMEFTDGSGLTYDSPVTSTTSSSHLHDNYQVHNSYKNPAISLHSEGSTVDSDPNPSVIDAGSEQHAVVDTNGSEQQAVVDTNVVTLDGSNEMLYSCDYCSYKSTVKFNFLRHLKRHTGEKPYSCTFCPYRSIEKKCLLYHLYNRHNVIAK